MSVVSDPVRAKIEQVTSERENGEEDAFFVLDRESLNAQHGLWKKELPQVTGHYAVKCNNHPEVLKQLLKLGAHFDCASREEMRLVLGLGASPSQIIYANPVKAPSNLRYAAEVGVKRMTFDNVVELAKIKQWAPNSELLLRIKTDDSGAVCSLSCKFGAAPHQTTELLREAQKLGLHVVGVAYHVGSGGGTGPEAHHKALQDAREVFDIASTQFGLKLAVLDVGGGFEPEPNNFKPVAEQIRKTLAELKFPEGVQIIGEPGRFMVAPAFTLVANVLGVRPAPEDSGEVDMVYISDGVYGNLNSIIYDHQVAKPYLVGDWEMSSSKSVESSLWGPTCDGLDSVASKAAFFRRLKTGDWLYFVEAGAYTLVGESAFNGFNTNTQVYVAR